MAERKMFQKQAKTSSAKEAPTPSLASLRHSLGASDIQIPRRKPSPSACLPPLPFFLASTPSVLIAPVIIRMLGRAVRRLDLPGIHGRPFRGDGRPIAHGVESSVRHW
jgi:hypothetical protein